jgi:hypothetical protein
MLLGGGWSTARADWKVELPGRRSAGARFAPWTNGDFRGDREGQVGAAERAVEPTGVERDGVAEHEVVDGGIDGHEVVRRA